MQKTFCDRCSKEIEGISQKRGGKDMCQPCAEQYDKFMENNQERKGFL